MLTKEAARETTGEVWDHLHPRRLDASDLYPGELWEHAYVDVRSFLQANGLKRQQGSLFFGTEAIDPVSCVVIVQRLAETFDWFRSAVRDLRLLRIEDDIDLRPALDRMSRRPG